MISELCLLKPAVSAGIPSLADHNCPFSSLLDSFFRSSLERECAASDRLGAKLNEALRGAIIDGGSNRPINLAVLIDIASVSWVRLLKLIKLIGVVLKICSNSQMFRTHNAFQITYQVKKIACRLGVRSNGYVVQIMHMGQMSRTTQTSHLYYGLYFTHFGLHHAL